MPTPGTPAASNVNAGTPLLTDLMALQPSNGVGWKVCTVAQLLALLGGGGTPVSVTVTASEAIGAAAFVNYYVNAGVGYVRNANASNPQAYANGFAPAAIAMGATGQMVGFGLNAVAVATPASTVWLSDTTPGGFSTAPPATAGHIRQPLGPAIAGAGVFFQPGEPEEL